MRKLPNTYVLIAALILLCAVLTWFVPGGQYVTADDGTLSYQTVPAAPQTWQVFSAIYHGFVKQAGIIVFILVVGGAFWLLNATGAGKYSPPGRKGVTRGHRHFLLTPGTPFLPGKPGSWPYWDSRSLHSSWGLPAGTGTCRKSPPSSWCWASCS